MLNIRCDDEAFIAYTMMDVSVICKKYGLRVTLEMMVDALNESSHLFTDDEKDLLGYILTTDQSVKL